LSLGAFPFGGGNALFGTLQAAASSGVATFSAVKIGKAGAGYRLVAQSGSLVAATSSLFDVVASTPVAIAKVSGDNQNQVPGAPLDQPLVAQLKDAFGNLVPGDTIIFKVTQGGGHFGALDSAIATSDAQGNASAQYTLGSSPGANAVQARIRKTPDSTVTFTASATSAGLHLAFLVQPTSASGGATIAPSVKVAVQDGSNTTQTGASTIVTLGLQG